MMILKTAPINREEYMDLSPANWNDLVHKVAIQSYHAARKMHRIEHIKVDKLVNGHTGLIEVYMTILLDSQLFQVVHSVSMHNLDALLAITQFNSDVSSAEKVLKFL